MTLRPPPDTEPEITMFRNKLLDGTIATIAAAALAVTVGVLAFKPAKGQATAPPSSLSITIGCVPAEMGQEFLAGRSAVVVGSGIDADGDVWVAFTTENRWFLNIITQDGRMCGFTGPGMWKLPGPGQGVPGKQT
jgi:hypothetical protein